MEIHIQIASHLIDLEAELRRLNYWQHEPITAEALGSTEPFCIDTMTTAQWLQFVFLPRMHLLLAAAQVPPGRCEVGPMADAYFSGASGTDRLLALINEIDSLVNRAQGG